MKKIAVMLCLLLALTSACTHCTTGQIRSALVPRMSDTTVALMVRGPEITRSYCTGVWVSETIILTAAHCVSDSTEVDFITHNVQPEVFETPSALFHGFVTAIDPQLDLALIKGAVPFEHERARLAKLSPAVGDDITTVGSTKGLTFSVSGGTVQAYRNRVEELTGPFMQFESSAYKGNSGGPVFDMQGQLCGIVVIGLPAPTMALAVHLQTIRKFLITNGV